MVLRLNLIDLRIQNLLSDLSHLLLDKRHRGHSLAHGAKTLKPFLPDGRYFSSGVVKILVKKGHVCNLVDIQEIQISLTGPCVFLTKIRVLELKRIHLLVPVLRWRNIGFKFALGWHKPWLHLLSRFYIWEFGAVIFVFKNLLFLTHYQIIIIFESIIGGYYNKDTLHKIINELFKYY